MSSTAEPRRHVSLLLFPVSDVAVLAPGIRPVFATADLPTLLHVIVLYLECLDSVSTAEPGDHVHQQAFWNALAARLKLPDAGARTDAATNSMRLFVGKVVQVAHLFMTCVKPAEDIPGVTFRQYCLLRFKSKRADVFAMAFDQILQNGVRAMPSKSDAECKELVSSTSVRFDVGYAVALRLAEARIREVNLVPASAERNKPAAGAASME